MQKAERTKEKQPEQILSFIFGQEQCVPQQYLATVIPYRTVAYPGILLVGGGGVQQIQLRTEGRENGDLGAVAP